jgi:basic membrane lipoprotein Med (substrate-binding protein (PBP1-ABC) superfamily)
MEPTINKAVAAVIGDSFKAENYGPLSHMRVGGCSIAPLDPKLVPADVISMVAAMEKAIRDGSFKTPINDTEPKSNAG